MGLETTEKKTRSQNIVLDRQSCDRFTYKGVTYKTVCLPGNCKTGSRGVLSIWVLIWCYVSLNLRKLVARGEDSLSRWCIMECDPSGHTFCLDVCFCVAYLLPFSSLHPHHSQLKRNKRKWSWHKVVKTLT